MKVVTSGTPYIDIDAYAGCIAYAELLNLQGHSAIAASTARWNESISSIVRSWNAPFETHYVANTEDTYTLIDVSDPRHFDIFVALDRVEEVIDHHPSFETYWNGTLGEKGHVEFIGAAATLVYEHWKSADLQSKMSVTSARLLICAILDNTLNFKAKVTTPRDIRAYEELLLIADLPEDFTTLYFNECQSAILTDVASAMRDDMKQLNFTKLDYDKIPIGQLVIWDARIILEEYSSTIIETMDQIKSEWLMSLVSISEGKNYFISHDAKVKHWVESTLNVTFDGSVAVSDRMWLRKEIIKQDSL